MPPASVGRGPSLSFFDITYVIELPDHPGNSTIALSHPLTLRREGNHLKFDIDYITHADSVAAFHSFRSGRLPRRLPCIELHDRSRVWIPVYWRWPRSRIGA